MKNLYLILFCALLVQNVNAQIIPSSCTAPDSVVQKYIVDAKGLAPKAMQKIGAAYYDSAIIPQEWTDTMLHALLAVYNTTSGARDSVVGYHVHCTEFKDIDKFYLYADTGLGWIQDFKNGVWPTRDTAVNSLIDRYNLVKKSFTISGVQAIILFQSDSIYNLNGMSEAWNKIDTVILYPDVLFTTSTIFVDTMTTDYIQLRFRYSCGVDCPSSCEVNRYWKYKVYNNCSVEYLGSYGSPIKSVGCINLELDVKNATQQGVKIYPNPFFDRLKIEGISKEATYIITNVVGQECLSGILNASTEINTAGLKAGAYFIKLQEGGNVQTIKLAKTE
jgi:hypothetical protein